MPFDTSPRRPILSSALALSIALLPTSLPARAMGAKSSGLVAVADPLQGLKLEVPATKMVLSNGLTLIVHEDHSAPLVAVRLTYHVGSKDEPRGKTGFAHLFEHLMFTGSENFNSDYYRATEKLGATEQNGTTSVDQTNYFETVPTAALDAILWLESDRMGHLLGTVDQARLDEQRAVVKNEKRQGENRPYAKASDLIIRATSSVGHPYDHRVIGSMEDLDSATLEDVKGWFRTWYGPSNAVLVLSGDVTPEAALAKVEKYFGDIAPGAPVVHPKRWIEKRTGTVRETGFDRAAQARLFRIWNVSDYAAADTDYLRVLGDVLAGGKNSRLYKRLVRDEQLATSVEAGVDNREIGGQFEIVATVKPGGDVDRVEATIDEELNRLITKGPEPAELRRVRTAILADLARSLESIALKASILAESQTFLGNTEGWKASFERIRAATPADVQRAGRAWLSDGDYALSLLPFGEPKAGTLSADRKTVPIPDAVITATFPAVERATLSNGLRLVVARRTGAPLIELNLLVGTGVPADFATVPAGTGSLAMGLLSDGTKTRTGQQLNDALDALGTTLRAGGGGETSAVSMSVLKPALQPSLALFADVVMNPAFAQKDLDRAKAQTVARIEAQRQSPRDTATRVLPKLMFGGSSAYGRLSTPDSIQAIDRSAVLAFHERWFRPSNATLIVAGDASLAEIRPLIESAFASWKRGDVTEPITPTSTPADKAVVYLIDRPGAPQSVIRAALLAPPRSEGDEIARDVFNTAFGGSFTSRVNMKLRQEKGWAYGARSSIGGGRGSRVFSATASVQSDKTAESMAEIAALLRGVTDDKPINAQELATAKDNMSLGLSSAWSSNSGVSQYLSDQVANGLPQDHLKRYTGLIAAETLDAANAVASALIAHRPLTWLVVGDRKLIESRIRALNLGELRVIDADGETN
ncbi:M16 family metallopeptidase [Burkholderiaceae bacterium UC74_6]